MIKKLVLLVLVFVIAISLIVLIRVRKKELAQLKPPKTYPVIVKTIKPAVSDFYLSMSGLGLIESSVDFNVTTKLAARVLYLKPIGSRVKKGEVVVKLDSSSTKAKIASAQSSLKSLYSKLTSVKLSLKNMILTHRRTKALLKVKGASIEQYQKEEDIISSLKSSIDAVKSQIKSIKSDITSLKTLLSYTVIKSPVEGIISKKYSNVGDVAMPGKPICSISSKGGKYVLLRLPDDIKPKGVIFKGKFLNVVALNSTFNGLNEYKADVNTTLNTNTRVKVGIVIFKGKAIKLPFNAVLSDNGKDYVFVADKDRAIPEKIKIIASGEQGLAVNDKSILGKQIVITKPDIFIKLLGGVRIVKE